MHLTGNVRHTVDAKLRLKLPANFRREFGEQVCLLPMGDSVYGFTPEGHEAYVGTFFPEGFDPRNRDQVRLRRWLNSATVTVDIDGAGRICLGKMPEDARPALGDDRQVVLVGNEDHFEVWSVDDWEQEQLGKAEVEALLFG